MLPFIYHSIFYIFMNSFLYSQPVLDLITIATEYCKQVEQTEGEERNHFIEVMRGILPMIYLKMSLLGDVPEIPGFNEGKLTEADYDYIRHNVAAILAERDDYLDVFVEDFKYSDQPVLCTISENLADIYQVLRELVETFREGFEEPMQVALFEAVEKFKLYWGQTLLNALRALHDAQFGGNYQE